jgi:hypothetical protein
VVSVAPAAHEGDAVSAVSVRCVVGRWTTAEAEAGTTARAASPAASESERKIDMRTATLDAHRTCGFPSTPRAAPDR